MFIDVIISIIIVIRRGYNFFVYFLFLIIMCNYVASNSRSFSLLCSEKITFKNLLWWRNYMITPLTVIDESAIIFLCPPFVTFLQVLVQTELTKKTNNH